MRRRSELKPRNTLDNRLWVRLRALDGYRFRRKSPFKTFTLDFVEHDRRLVISLEGGEPGRRSTTIIRDRLLNEQGYVILRLWRSELERDLSIGLHRIHAVLEDLSADS
jgi:very-short-patch-repair endonuclease